MSHYNIPMISGSKAPDFDAYGLLRAMHSHVSAPLRSVLNMCHWHIAPYLYSHIVGLSAYMIRNCLIIWD